MTTLGISGDVVFLDLLVERGAVDSQHGSRFLDIALGALEGGGDQDLLHVLHRHAGGDLPGGSRGADSRQEREIAFGQCGPAASYDGALHGVFQFAHVARPVVIQQQAQRSLADLAHVLAQLVGEALHEVIGQQRNVLAPRAQRRECESRSRSGGSRDRRGTCLPPPPAADSRGSPPPRARRRAPLRCRPRGKRRDPAGRAAGPPATSAKCRRSRPGRWCRCRPSRTFRASAGWRR